TWSSLLLRQPPLPLLLRRASSSNHLNRSSNRRRNRPSSLNKLGLRVRKGLGPPPEPLAQAGGFYFLRERNLIWGRDAACRVSRRSRYGHPPSIAQPSANFTRLSAEIAPSVRANPEGRKLRSQRQKALTTLKAVRLACRI